MSTSSETLNACRTGSFPTASSNRSFGTTITVSATSRSRSRPASAFVRRTSPSAVNGVVTIAIVSASASCAASATIGAEPVPVPPPSPAVTNTISEVAMASWISSCDSSAASSPICGREPAPRPWVFRSPRRIFVSAEISTRCCTSVLAATKVAPLMPSSNIRLTVLPPAPPQPMTVISVSSSPSTSRSCSSVIVPPRDACSLAGAAAWSAASSACSMASFTIESILTARYPTLSNHCSPSEMSCSRIGS
jgi:hypothetical protein